MAERRVAGFAPKQGMQLCVGVSNMRGARRGGAAAAGRELTRRDLKTTKDAGQETTAQAARATPSAGREPGGAPRPRP